MRLTLAIENFNNLPDGGPLSVTVNGQRGLDIGRDQYLDWALPDPTRFISGKHCEVRVQNGEYLLYDVSTNGTLLNGAEHRMQSPHRLRTGDRLTIGQYIIGVTVEGASVQPDQTGSAVEPSASYGDLWAPAGDVADPINPNDLRPRNQGRSVHGDWIDRVAEVPVPVASPDNVFRPLPPVQPPASHFDWAPEPPRAPPEPEPFLPPPNPRRVVSPDRGGPWTDEAGAASLSQVSPPPGDKPEAWAPTEDISPTPRMSPAVWKNEDSPVAAEDKPAPLKSPPPSERPTFENSRAVDEFIRAFAAAAGIEETALDRAKPEELAKKLGAFVRLTVAEMRQMLGARTEAKRLARSANQTVVQAFDNNPLKFSPTDEDVMRCFFGPPLRSYLDAQRAIGQGFADLKSHQVHTYAAMQQAVRQLAEDLDPAQVEGSLGADGGLSAMLGSKKARLWDAYVTRWQAKTARRDDGLVDVFMQYFADCYDRIDRG